MTLDALRSSNPQDQRFPRGLALMATGSALACLAWIVWTLSTVQRAMDSEIQHARRAEAVRGRILHLDEVLTMSANMAAATGDLAWETRYRKYESKLDEAIREGRELSTETEPAAAATDEANLALVAMENDAFERVRHGDLAGARAILAGPAYVREKRRYAQGMVAFLDRSEKDVETMEAATRRRLDLSIAAAAVLTLCSTVLGCVAFGALRRWRHGLREVNLLLETTVVNRTAELEHTRRALEERLVALEAAQAELVESEERFRLIAESIPEVFWIASPDLTRVHYVSPAFESVWGIPREELLADPMTWLRSIEPEDRERVEQAARAQTRTGSYEETYRVVRPDGSRRWIRDRGVVVRDAMGSVRLVGVASDVTEARRTEEQLLQARKMEAIGRLAGGVAHDFNNLLTSIRGYASFAVEATDPGSPIREDLGEVVRAADRAAELTRQLLAFSRRQEIRPRVIDVATAVRDLERMLRRLIPEDITFLVLVDPRPCLVRADQVQFDQVVLNLVVNARDAMPTGGALTLEVSGPRPCAHVQETTIVVIDTGHGMDEATREHLFEPYFTTKELGKGTGLGLSTAYAIVEKAGGRIEVESAPGQGSTFRVLFPAEEAPECSVPAAHPVLAAGGTPTGTILVVDDEEPLRRLVCRVLEKAGYVVLEASGGEDALRHLASWRGAIDLVLTDVVMPGMSGPELGSRARDLRPDLSVAYMTGYSEARSGHPALDSEPLRKPFPTQALLEHVRDALATEGEPAGAQSKSRCRGGG